MRTSWSVGRVVSRGLVLSAVVAAACQSAAGGGDQAATTATRESCLIDRVIDGDTVVCTDDTRVRLLLIDTPEMDQGPFGQDARAVLLRILPPGTPTAMELDVQRLDRYGRTLAYLYAPDGRMANEEMARLGYAVPLTYPPNVRYVDRIGTAVQEARSARRGLWAGSAFECEPVRHRRGACE